MPYPHSSNNCLVTNLFCFVQMIKCQQHKGNTGNKEAEIFQVILYTNKSKQHNIKSIQCYTTM